MALRPRRLFETRATRAARLAPGVRWGTAAVFIIFGAGKFAAHASEVASFRNYGLPSPGALAYAIGVLEVAGGLALASGAVTRLAALLLAGDMIGAITVAGIGHGDVVPSLTLAPVLLLAMGFLLRVGPGARALDNRVAARR